MPTGTGAPICNAKAIQPQFPQTALQIPTFSVPNTGSPLINLLIAQLQQAFQGLTNQLPQNNLAANPGGGGGIGGGGGGGGGKKKPQPKDPDQWQEKSRQTQNVKVVNPDDDSQFVIVKEITQIVFERPSTGEEITIYRDPP